MRWEYDNNDNILITQQHFMWIIGENRNMKEVFSDHSLQKQVEMLNKAMDKNTEVELCRRSKWHITQEKTDYKPGDIIIYYHQPRGTQNKKWSLGKIISKEGRTSYNLLTSHHTEITQDARHLIDYLEVDPQ